MSISPKLDMMPIVDLKLQDVKDIFTFIECKLIHQYIENTMILINLIENSHFTQIFGLSMMK